MKTLYLVLFLHASLQLQCDKRKITALIGGEFFLICQYDTSIFRFNKKYWCRGESRNTCKILTDSETKSTHRSRVIDVGRKGLFVKVTHLQSEDSGVYWLGIDKVYADIMISVNVVITEVPVSKPKLWPLSSLMNRPTCWGKPVTVRCGCTTGSAIRYAWYQQIAHKDALLHNSSDLWLHCGTVEKDSNYYCSASNNVNSLDSDILSVQVLMPGDNNCIYVVNIQGQPIYDCLDRMSTTTVKPPTTCQSTIKVYTDKRNQSLQLNQTDRELSFSRAWMGMPLWYTVLRWSSSVSLLMSLCIVIKCAKIRHRKYTKRNKKVKFKQIPHSAK